VFHVRTLEDYLFDSVAQPRFNALLLAAVAVLASGVPAWRATRLNPTEALRGE